jgi:protein TonB
VPPNYPLNAMKKGLEGYVLLRFTVTETGAVSDPEVLRAEPPIVFDRAAKRAILRWKYQPQVVNGKPTAVTSYARIKFELADAAQQQ